MSIFDIGRTTGAVGGIDYSIDKGIKRTGANLDNQEKSISVNQKHAEFLDYLDAREARVLARKAGMATDQSTIDTTPSKTASDIATNQQVVDTTPSDTDAKIAGNVQKAQQAKSDTSQIKAQEEAENIALQGAVIGAVSDKTVGASASFLEAIASGQPVEAAYRTAYDTMMSTSPAPEKLAALMKASGVSAEFSVQSAQNLIQFAKAMYHDKSLTGQEHLMVQEYEYKLKIAIAGASADTMLTDPITANMVGDQLVADAFFRDLEGEWDPEQKKYTEMKGAVAASISFKANEARGIFQRPGFPIPPETIGGIMMQIATTMPGLFTIDELSKNKWERETFNKISQDIIHLTVASAKQRGIGFRDAWMIDGNRLMEEARLSYAVAALNKSASKAAANSDAKREEKQSPTSPGGYRGGGPRQAGPAGKSVVESLGPSAAPTKSRY